MAQAGVLCACTDDMHIWKERGWGTFFAIRAAAELRWYHNNVIHKSAKQAGQERALHHHPLPLPLYSSAPFSLPLLLSSLVFLAYTVSYYALSFRLAFA